MHIYWRTKKSHSNKMTHTRIYRLYELCLKASAKDDKIFGAGGSLLMPYRLTKRY